MAEKLHFSLVSPDRELFAGEVDHVVAPGTEGEFGVLPRHAPFMATIKPGALRILNDGGERLIFVNGGFADVTPEGLTVLAEDAVDLAEVDPAGLEADIKDARDDLADTADAAIKAVLEKKLARLVALRTALGR
jgi:F-type H+-transporting ATPase subunit epsilon